MEFYEYQKDALSTAVYPNLGNNLIYPALKLAGEAGEVAEKIGKFSRKSGIAFPTRSDMDYYYAESIALELSDCLWYINALAMELGFTLDDIAAMNLDKLASRKERGVLIGEGDNR
jgi:NTP pyrophosphatase (non-canonical NTP hydrolase)